jgi:hypothetical protein
LFKLEGAVTAAVDVDLGAGGAGEGVAAEFGNEATDFVWGDFYAEQVADSRGLYRKQCRGGRCWLGSRRPRLGSRMSEVSPTFSSNDERFGCFEHKLRVRGGWELQESLGW